MELVKICRESNFHFPPFPFLCFCFGWAGEEETVPWRKQKGNNLPRSERATAKTDPETKKNCLRKQTGTGRKAQDGNDYPWVKRENQQVEIPTQSRKGMFSDIQIVFFFKKSSSFREEGVRKKAGMTVLHQQLWGAPPWHYVSLFPFSCS